MVVQISEKGDDFLLRKMYFTSGDGYQNFSVFATMLSLLTLDGNKKDTNRKSSGISAGKFNFISNHIKSFDTNLEPAMSNLANGIVILNFNNSVVVQKFLFIV